MDQGKNLLELNEELIDLGFNTREFIDDIRKAIYERNVYKQVAYQDGTVRLNLNFGKDDYARFNFFDYNVHYPGAKEGEHFQAFEGEVPLPEAKKLLESRIRSEFLNPPDAQTPLFLSDVRLEQQSLDQNRLNPPGVYGGIDTIELDKRMQAVDWQRHPGYWADSRDDPKDKQLTEMRRIEKELDVLESLRGNRQSLNASEKLMLKYFTGTPAERMVVEDIPYLHASFEAHKKQINQVPLNHYFMNKQNSEFLKKALLNLGFGVQLNAELDKQLNKKSPEFKLNAQNEYNGQKVEYLLYFKAGKDSELYFLNKYDAAYKTDNGKEQHQAFYINKGNGVTAKEAYNLMEGRAVFKQMTNKENEKYHTWIKLDPKDLTDGGNQRIKQFNFDLEKLLDGKGIKQMEHPDSRDELMRSLKKGNRQQISVGTNDSETKYFISASPQFKTIDLFDDKMKKIKREQLIGESPAEKAPQSQKEQHQEGKAEKKSKSLKVGA